MRQLRLYLNGQSGATAVEYAMIAALISIVIISGATLVGQAISGKFNYVATTVAAVPPS
jgi:pilus assembly protein Flp/PilA